MLNWKLLLLLPMIVTGSAIQKDRFDNYRLYSIPIETSDQLQLFQALDDKHDDNSNGFLLWNYPVLGGVADIMVPPNKLSEFTDMTNLYNLKIDLKIKNIQSLIDAEIPTIRPRSFGWTAYHNYTEIYAWLDELLETYPSILTRHTVGTSFEGREIRAVKLSYKEGNPTIFIEANIHAREWITSATATCFLNELLTSTDPAIQDLAQNIDWYIVPVFNVDGFHYTHTVNRLWRKTRQPHAHLCYGTDANRNFGFHWLEGGSSQNPCSETYAGPEAFSEPETRALADFLGSLDEVNIFLAFHSYGHYILHPYGHVTDPVENVDTLTQIGLRIAEGFAARYNSTYTLGSFGEALYIGSGTSVDYMYSAYGVNISYTFEFRDQGTYGFVLPPEQIIPNCQETTDAIIAMVQAARELGQI